MNRGSIFDLYVHIKEVVNGKKEMKIMNSNVKGLQTQSTNALNFPTTNYSVYMTAIMIFRSTVIFKPFKGTKINNKGGIIS